MPTRQQPVLAPPVNNLKIVTPYANGSRVRATMDDITLRSLVPAGTPIVLHLYTG